MGLDMYLEKKTYIGAEYKHNKIAGSIELTKDGKRIPINLKRLNYIEERVGYWRKANQIHKWFVDNVQKGKDDCGEYYVTKEDFEKLLADCKAVKQNQEVASEVLPTQAGFFFGGTEYDEYYMQDIDATIEIVESVLKEIEEEKKDKFFADYYYSSSW